MLRTVARLLTAATGGLLLATATATATAPAPVAASCRAPVALVEAVREADVVIVGTVVGTANQDRLATVALEEIWKGPDQPDRVMIDGGPGGGAISSSVDRSFVLGTRYLFVLHGGEQGAFRDNACSATTPWEAAFAGLRPADARTRTVEETETLSALDLSGLVGPALLVVFVSLALLGVGLLARGRQTA